MAIKITRNKGIVLKGAKLDALHDLFHLLEQFKYITSTYCMVREKEQCHAIAEKIKDNIEDILI